MSAYISNLVDVEIQQLISKGWKDFPPEADCLRTAARLRDSEISFPHQAYNLEIGNSEASGVWAKWRAKQILRVLKRFEFELLWEVGSGHGNVAIPLQSNGIAVIGIEPLLNGAKITAGSGVRTYLGTLESLNLPSNSISVIGAFDVLEHLENPVVLLSEMYRVLEPGGLLLVSVPAHKWLFSDFDESIGHHRRYSRKDLSQQLQQSGFLDRRFEFMFSIFVPPAYILRKLPSLFGRSRNANSTTRSYRNQSKIIDALEPTLMPFLYLERLLHLPFGLSLFGVCKK